MAMFTSSRLSEAVVVYEPSRNSHYGEQKVGTNKPFTILLLSWMNANPRQVDYVAKGYQQMYLQSTILAISCSYMDFMFRRQLAQRERLAEAAAFLSETLDTQEIYVHFFSLGGGLSLLNIAKAYHYFFNKQLSVQAMVLDSCPGRSTVRRGFSAMTEALPRPWYLKVSFGLLLLLLWFVTYPWTHRAAKRIWIGLNDRKLVTLSVRKFYLYSMEDSITFADDVEEHIREAKENGYSVQAEIYKHGRHVGLLRHDEVRYWAAIKMFFTSCVPEKDISTSMIQS